MDFWSLQQQQQVRVRKYTCESVHITMIETKKERSSKMCEREREREMCASEYFNACKRKKRKKYLFLYTLNINENNR
mgnify:CR=1 FL=1